MVRQLRTATAGVASDISDTTKADYSKKYERMVRLKRPPEGMAKSSGGFYAYRAAFLHGTAQEARAALKLRDQSPYGSPKWEAAMQKIRICLSRFQRYPADPKRERVGQSEHQHITWATVREQITEIPVRRSKRAVLSYLRHKPGWHDTLFGAVSERYKAAAAVAALTGCRPSELVRGVKVQLRDDSLLVAISGTKVSQQSGQPTRLLRLAIDSAEARYLAALCEAGDAIVQIRSANAFGEAIAAAGRTAFPRARQRISPYVLRHSVASDLKSSYGPDDTAAALGHQVTRTQERYGRAVHGGRSAITGVHATRAVRHTHRDPSPALKPSPLPAYAPRFG